MKILLQYFAKKHMADNFSTKQEKSLQILLVARGIVIDNNNYVLLLKRDHKTNWNPNKWEIPGGKPKFGENLNECIINEVFEETGLTVKIIDNSLVPNSHIEHEFKLYEGYLVIESCNLCQVIGYNNVKLSDEHKEFVWVNKYEALSYDLTKQSRNAIATFFDKI